MTDDGTIYRTKKDMLGDPLFWIFGTFCGAIVLGMLGYSVWLLL